MCCGTPRRSTHFGKMEVKTISNKPMTCQSSSSVADDPRWQAVGRAASRGRSAGLTVRQLVWTPRHYPPHKPVSHPCYATTAPAFVTGLGNVGSPAPAGPSRPSFQELDNDRHNPSNTILLSTYHCFCFDSLSIFYGSYVAPFVVIFCSYKEEIPKIITFSTVTLLFS